MQPTLSEWLEQPVPYRLALLRGPAGSGKSCRLGAWLAQRQVRSPGSAALLRLSSAHNQPGVFLAGLWASLSPILGEGGIWDRGEGADLAFDLQDGMVDLLNALDAAGPALFFLALDDYHAIQNPAVHAAVTLALDYLPAHTRLVIASREAPPLPLARLRARRQLREIRDPRVGGVVDPRRSKQREGREKDTPGHTPFVFFATFRDIRVPNPAPFRGSRGPNPRPRYNYLHHSCPLLRSPCSPPSPNTGPSSST